MTKNGLFRPKEILQSGHKAWALALAKGLGQTVKNDCQNNNSQTTLKTKADIHALDPA
jgi:hypothetical protein